LDSYGDDEFLISNNSKEGKGQGFQCKIDELRLYNLALSANEIIALQKSQVEPLHELRWYENRTTSFASLYSQSAGKVTFTKIAENKELKSEKFRAGLNIRGLVGRRGKF
jgi:hypothetical protein